MNLRGLETWFDAMVHLDNDSSEQPDGLQEVSWVEERCSRGLGPIISNHWKKERWEGMNGAHFNILTTYKAPVLLCFILDAVQSLEVHWTGTLCYRPEVLKYSNLVSHKSLSKDWALTRIETKLLCFSAKGIDVFRQSVSIFLIFGEFRGRDQLQKCYWT